MQCFLLRLSLQIQLTQGVQNHSCVACRIDFVHPVMARAGDKGGMKPKNDAQNFHVGFFFYPFLSIRSINTLSNCSRPDNPGHCINIETLLLRDMCVQWVTC